MSAKETAWSIITDPNHTAAEVFYDVVVALVELPFIILWRKRHDRTVHGTVK